MSHPHQQRPSNRSRAPKRAPRRPWPQGPLGVALALALAVWPVGSACRSSDEKQGEQAPDAPQAAAPGAPNEQAAEEASAPEAAASEQPEPEEEAKPSEPDPREALRAGRYEIVCDYLERRYFSRGVCDFLAARARGERVYLRRSTAWSFFRKQKVRKRYGRIVDVFSTAGVGYTYEARIGGRLALLQTTETVYTTTGRFGLWTQHVGEQTVTLISGRDKDVPLYMEWPFAKELISLARRTRGTADDARDLLDDLLDYWEDVWLHPQLKARLDRGELPPSVLEKERERAAQQEQDQPAPAGESGGTAAPEPTP